MAGSEPFVKVLDGHDTIGGTKVLVGWGDEGGLLDFGVNYARWGRYFEEYVKPRTTSGLGDLWKLGLVPRSDGLYRADVVPPGLPAGDPLPVARVGGAFVSHAHLDHAGLVGLLDIRIPLVASKLTAAILKATQDAGKTELWGSPCYGTPYRRGDHRGHPVLESDGRAAKVGRRLLLTDGAPSPAFERFWRTLPWNEDGAGKGKRLQGGDVARHDGDTGLKVRAHPVDHSVLGGCAYVLESPNGPIVYTGDLRAHGLRAAETTSFLDGLVRRRPWILLMEGTQVQRPGEGDPAEREPRTEATVKAFSLGTVEDYRGRLVLADFAPRNVERLLSFLDIAKRTGRRLVVFPKDAYLLYAMHQADPSIPTPGRELGIYDPPSGREDRWETWLLDAQFPDALVDVDEIRRAPGEHLLCFSYFDLKHLLDIEPKGGAYIYSNSEAHSEEQEIDFERLHAWLEFFGLDALGFRLVEDPRRPGKLRPRAEGGYHCSGHMPGAEILDWVVRIHPENLAPVHTTYADGFVEAVRKFTDVRVHHGGLIR